MMVPFMLAAAAFLLTVPWGGWTVRTLLAHGIGKRIRVDGPSSHLAKAGTATMGGVYILASVAVLVIALVLAGYTTLLVPLVVMVSFGLLGAYDDLQGLKDRAGVGWLARFKFLWQWFVAILMAVVMFLSDGERTGIVPGSGVFFDLGHWYIPVSALFLVGWSNAVNITDGLDGLAGGTSAIAFAVYGLICGLSGQRDLALFCAIVVGALLAFLWFNVHPARMFMGDTGSQALGAGLAAVAILSGHWPLLPLVGLVFALEALSVIFQVSYFKYTRRRYGEGRRILRMAPLHHHFELTGWNEVQTTLRFWLVALVAGGLAAALGVAGI
jgi:phospho-N-acetylmuramoyl-pentapeptide-transferase